MPERNQKIEVVDESGLPMDLTGRLIASAICDPQGGIAVVQLIPACPISPKVDETWTKADIRKLYRLLVKRTKIMDKIQVVNVKIMIADIQCACTIDDHLAGRK